MLSGEGAAGGRSKEGRNARWPARYTAKRPLDGARCLFVSLEGSSVGHQVPVIVHKLTSPGKFLLDSSRRCVPLPYKDNIPWPCVSIIFRSRFFHSLAERAKMPNGSLFHGFRGSLFHGSLVFLPSARFSDLANSTNVHSRKSIERFGSSVRLFLNISWNSSRFEDPSRTHLYYYYYYFSFPSKTCPTCGSSHTFHVSTGPRCTDTIYIKIPSSLLNETTRRDDVVTLSLSLSLVQLILLIYGYCPAPVTCLSHEV